MSNPTPAQEEFNALLAAQSRDTSRVHPEDRSNDRDSLDLDEEDVFRNSQIDAAMRIPTLGQTGSDLKLPPASFDAGRTTGVKGVIADARNYENARKTSFMSRARTTVRRSIFGLDGISQSQSSRKSESGTDDGNNSNSEDEESFLAQWRESRRRELESESSKVVRNRRTSPSVRIYGRMDEVDALGYLDAIEKVARDTVVVVFVYDPEVSFKVFLSMFRQVLTPSQHSTIHFVKVHYLDIEFDNAAVPSILAYRNQGDMFANLTGIIEMIPDDEAFGTDTLARLFEKHCIL
ncbi:Phosducin-like protein [Colletotrichum sp. SAR 10_99]|nr:Phosducin-like protein [Colletotrichum sp. SAR 10_96]KAI8251022.1 Phosducin-like protein [Colletotrichum sp. SAR11_239]KAI8295273.1 Phosducin-like protein [Colletotrichum sp. SAR 10_98]KAJ5011677.1 Phosducin-like protein [Colletotrichum sp. SAR 10_99]